MGDDTGAHRASEAPAVPGLRYVRDYLSAGEHDWLLSIAETATWSEHNGRQFQIYGYSYNHLLGGIYRVGDLPAWLAETGTRVHRDGLMPSLPDQVVVNGYPPGTGIPQHIDAEPFADAVVVLSLGSPCVMDLVEPGTGRADAVLLRPRSALVLADDARWRWRHGIEARTEDRWRGETIARGRRVSLTFRTMRRTSGYGPTP